MTARPSRALLLAALLCTSCRDEAATVAPPPLPEAPAPIATGVEPPAIEAAPKSELKPAKAREAKGSVGAPKPNAEARPKGWGAAYVPPPAPAAPPPVPTPAASKPAPAPAPAPAPEVAKPKTRVSVPRTAHVHAEIPGGLQADLDADPRMQPWVEKVIAIADNCHARARGNTGAIEAVITMHENERPDADVRSLPPQLGGVVACATGALLRTKMPLFTGREGTRYPVRIVFE